MNTLTETRKAELVELMMALPACTCVYKSRDDYSPIRFSRVDDCEHCKGRAVIEEEIFGEPLDYAKTEWLKRSRVSR